MADIFSDYKPFRNYLQRFNKIESLIDIWQYFVYLDFGQNLPSNYATGAPFSQRGNIGHHIFRWDLEVLTKEVILNARSFEKFNLKSWANLAQAINHIKRLEGASFKGGQESRSGDAWFEMYRIAHRQFPWQLNNGAEAMMRVFKIFGEENFSAIVERELGMTTQQFLWLGSAVSGNFLVHSGMSTNQDYNVLKISRESSDAFFSRITCTMDEIESNLRSRQSYNKDWIYTWNPLEAKPLIRFDPTHPDRVICPIPRLLQRRASSGIFYDMANASDFDNLYGGSFQAYVGDILKLTCSDDKFIIFAEQSYQIGRRHLHGVDWVISDENSYLAIECKTKRLTVNAKTHSDTAALQKDLQIIADAIVQHYRNILDSVAGYTGWKPTGQKIYPLIITLEDWHLFSPVVQDLLMKCVLESLTVKSISHSVLEEMPFTIASAFEFEIASQVIALTGIEKFMELKTDKEHRWWSLYPFTLEKFPDEVSKAKRTLFEDEWRRLVPKNIGGTPMYGPSGYGV